MSQCVDAQQDSLLQAGRICQEGVHRVGETMVKQACKFGIREAKHALAFVRMFENASWEKLAVEARMKSNSRSDVRGCTTVVQEKMLRTALQLGIKDEEKIKALLKKLEGLFWEKVAIKATYDAQLVLIRASLESPLLQTDSSDDNSNNGRVHSDGEESELEDYMPISNKGGKASRVSLKADQEKRKVEEGSGCEGDQHHLEEDEGIDPYLRQHKFKVGERVFLHQKVGPGPVTPSGPGRVFEHTRDHEGKPTYTIGEIFTSFRKRELNVEEKLLGHYSMNQGRPKRPRPTYSDFDDM